MKEAEIKVKEQLVKEKEVYKRMLGALGKPPRKDIQPQPSGISPTTRYAVLAGCVIVVAIGIQFTRSYFNLQYFKIY